MSLTYPNGFHKSKYRGYVHLFALIFVMPVKTYFMLSISNTYLQLFLRIFYLVTLSCLYFFSPILHIYITNIKTFITIRRIDHSFIFIIKLAIDYLIAFFIFNDYKIYSLILFTYSSIIVFIGVTYCCCKTVEKNEDKADTFTNILLVLIGITLIPFIYLFFLIFSTFEFTIFLLFNFFSGISFIIYKKEIFNCWKDTFGYHEFFHIFVVIANILSFIYTNSIISKIYI
jgi:predicted membrane channel-forming protein YqfA (hemolysin III family)